VQLPDMVRSERSCGISNLTCAYVLRPRATKE
jgi:hypothetical protein